ncbi:Poly(A) polymerase 1 isoform 1 [Hibiscus syriacus]|uniref:Poly(A) polymerase 1 isoform 1 n=1 Tax=Hibiscus syriacus TaxID=106335 RepID=A0A6A3BS57_HIBSY|nr:Poly(A) polymerase 1 isoform 1 [Hibiscus syriacus]
MEEDELDYLLVPLGLLLLLLYHVWLLFTIIKHPSKTVVGLNAQSRHQWVFCMMSDPLKNGVLAVQTIRNNIMASTLLATISITLSSLIGVFVSSDADNSTSEIVFGNKTPLLSAIKYFSILLCFLVAFLCNVQCIRYYAHVSFLITLPASVDNTETVTSQNTARGIVGMPRVEGYLCSSGHMDCLPMFFGTYGLFTYVLRDIWTVYLCSSGHMDCLPMFFGTYGLFTYVLRDIWTVYLGSSESMDWSFGTLIELL